MQFNEAFLMELAERNDIADVVSEYVRLGKRSGANLFGLCPFHNEKTPSFCVSPDKQIYHCFGCGKGGGVINFIMEIEGLSFPEAVEFLAKRAGMELPRETDDREGRQRARLYELNREAARFFYNQLQLPSGESGRAYVLQRRLTAKTVKTFGLGYAPPGWDSLAKAMRALGYTEQELLEADLVRRGKNGGVYDTFRNRLMFPVIDVRGNVAGFSGRIVGEGEPKYLNSRETPVYSKGKLLFGLNLARKSKRDYLILVEGNVDVVSLHQAGFDSAIAALGTALTNEQARLISRYKNEVILAYGSDGAGLKASQRSIDILEKLDVKVRVLRWQDAKDPDEYIQKFGGDAFLNLIERSESQIDYRLQNIRKKYDLSVPEQKMDFLREATRLVASFPDSVERQVYAMRVAEIAGISADAVIKEVEHQRKRLFSGARKDLERANRAISTVQPPERALKYDDPYSATAEEGVIRLLFLEPSLAGTAEELIREEEFTSRTLGKIYTLLLERIREHRAVNATVMSEQLSGEEMSLLIRLLEKPEALANAKETLQDYVRTIKKRRETVEPAPDLRQLADRLRKNDGKGYRA